MNFRTQYRPDQVHPSALIARGAVVVGDVTIGAGAGIWFGAVVRGDTEAVHVGERTNIQDGAILHADPGFPCHVGEGVTVGHGAIVHGANVGNNVTIGMRAVVLNGARIGENSLVGACALVTEGVDIPPGSLVLGVPGKVVRSLSSDEIKHIARSASHYVEAAAAFAREQATSPQP
jgi:carbonic anhydrase/acetyltransferase-like protein (isoleucine patch superfamily)